MNDIRHRWVLGASIAMTVGCGSAPDEVVSSPDSRPTPVIASAVAPSRPEPVARYVGVVAAGKTVELAPTHAGTLVTVEVNAGDHVQRGDVVATTDVQRAEQDLRVIDARLRSTRAAVSQARIRLDQAEQVVVETKALVTAGHAPRRSLDEARLERRQAKAGVKLARADVAEADARRGQMQANLERTELRAPFAGVVAARHLDPGSMTGPGAAVVRLIGDDDQRVRFAVPVTEASRLRPGAAVTVQIDASALEVAGTVQQIAPEVDPAADLVFCEATLDLPSTLSSPLHTGAAAVVFTTRSDGAQGATPAEPADH